MQTIENFEKEIRIKAVLVYTVILAVLLNRFFSRTLLSQIGDAITDTNQPEFVYSVFTQTGLAYYFLSHHSVSAIFDIALFFTPIFFLALGKRIFAMSFTLLVVFYFLTFNVTAYHHYHGLFAVVVISIPFWSKDETRFNFLWEAARYYLLYVFSSAAVWKALRGSAFYKEQLSNILKHQQLDLLLQQPESLRASIVQYLITNPEISHLVLLVNVIVQLSFMVGFVTKKFDSILFALAIVFCTANYFVMNIVSAEILILNLTLLNWKKSMTAFNANQSLHHQLSDF